MDDAYGELPFPRTDIALSAMRFVQDIEDRVGGARCAAENVNASTAPLGTRQSGRP